MSRSRSLLWRRTRKTDRKRIRVSQWRFVHQRRRQRQRLCFLTTATHKVPAKHLFELGDLILALHQ